MNLANRVLGIISEAGATTKLPVILSGGRGGGFPETRDKPEFVDKKDWDALEKEFNQRYSEAAEEEYPDDEEADFAYAEGTADEARGFVFCTSDKAQATQKYVDTLKEVAIVFWTTGVRKCKAKIDKKDVDVYMIAGISGP